MKKSIMLVLVVALLCTTLTPVMAAEIPATSNDYQQITGLNRYAYMDLEEADAATQQIILEARKEIIFSTSWVADGLYGYITDSDGIVQEVVPQFSEVFPADWEVPVDINTSAVATPYSWQHSFNGVVILRRPPTSGTPSPFHQLSTGVFNNLYVKTISTVGYNTSGTYNVGYINQTTGKSLGYAENLANGKSFNITAPTNATVGIYASTHTAVGEWNMQVVVDRVSTLA